MKPIDVQNLVLLALDMSIGRAMPSIMRSVTAATGEGPAFREVASAVIRLERQGLVYQYSEEVSGLDVWPTYALTAAGALEASAIRRLRPQEVV